MYSLKSIFYKQFSVTNSRLMSLIIDKALINGEWISGIENKKFNVINPANNEIIGSVPNLNISDVSYAIDSASQAFERWKFTTPKERSNLLRTWYNLLVENANEIADIITAEAGKPKVESITEVKYGNSFIEWFSEEARRINGEIINGQDKSKQMIFIKQPIGAVGLITPWNFPFAMITRKAGAALAAGCTCIIKPAEDTPLTALALGSFAEKAGFPPGVINVITCDRNNAADVGKLLCTHEKISGISFTGSTAVGKLLYAHCAQGVKRIALELGGNAPFIVFESANLDKAIDGVVASKFRNCGQTCVSPNRFLVHEKIVNDFIAKLICKIDNFIIGEGSNLNVNIGPLINQAQLNKVSKLVNDAISKGAKVLKGGKQLQDKGKLFYAPTILTNIKENMDCYKEEIFGPVIQIIEFRTEEEAINIANDTRSGLAGYFYSEDIRQIWRVAKLMEVGMIGINDGGISCAEAAFGGVKESGIGREGSHYGIDEYINLKYLCFGNLE